MKILVLDNYDSFVYNLVQMVREITDAEVVVARNDEIELEAIDVYDRILLSPGPGLPCEAGIMPELLARYAPKKRIMGVCLGHQGIGEAFGATLENMPEPSHGLSLNTTVIEDGHALFQGFPTEFASGRYHSWTVSKRGVPSCLRILAQDDQGRIMALAHTEFDVVGVQFHPESVLTPNGGALLKNWLR